MTEHGESKSKLEEELQHTGPEARTWYLKLLSKLRVQKTKEAHGYADISEEEKLALLNRARQKAQYGNVDPEKMARDWERHNKRPPVAGSQPDVD